MKISFENLAKLKLLLSVAHIGPSRILKLLAKFDNFDSIFRADLSQLSSVDSFNRQLSSYIIKAFKNLDYEKKKLDSELNQLSKIGARLISFWDEEYPGNLKKIYYPPLILYIKGKLTDQDKNSISIVGTRKPSEYGKEQSRHFSNALATKNLTIVSGMARGIDSIAHKGALKVGGRTIAVIGSGIDVIYPPENRDLFNAIADSGAVITEFEVGSKPDASNFPRRNRIISGLSLGTLIVETKFIGGAMQTASHALDQNREVFAVPGNIGSKQSEGTNSLIKKGEAKLVTDITDILVELNIPELESATRNERREPVNVNLFEQQILDVLSSSQKHIDNIADESGLSAPDCLINLLNLELKGLVRQLPGKNFIAS